MKPLLKFLFVFFVVSTSGLALAAKEIKTEDFSGWMEGYDTFTFDEDRNAFLFFNEDRRGTYEKVMLESVVIYSRDAEKNPVIADKATAYFSQGVQDLLERKGIVASEPGPGVGRLKLAITGFEISKEGLKGYHVLPVAAVFRGAQEASGKVAAYIDTRFEGEVVDSVDGERIIAIVAKGVQETSKRSGDSLRFEDVQPTLDLWLERFDKTLDDYLAKR
jgi:hypothetical protein